MFWRLFSGQSPAVVGRCGADVHGQKSRDRPSCSISLPNQQRPTVHHHPSRRHSPRNQSLKSSPVCCHHVDRSTITQIPPKLDMAISLLFTCHTTHCLATRESRVESLESSPRSASAPVFDHLPRPLRCQSFPLSNPLRKPATESPQLSSNAFKAFDLHQRQPLTGSSTGVPLDQVSPSLNTPCLGHGHSLYPRRRRSIDIGRRVLLLTTEVFSMETLPGDPACYCAPGLRTKSMPTGGLETSSSRSGGG